MNHFDDELTALFDLAAASITPRPDFERVLADSANAVKVVGRAGRQGPSRRAVSIAAAAAVVVGLPALAAAATMGDAGRSRVQTQAAASETVASIAVDTTPSPTVPTTVAASTTMATTSSSTSTSTSTTVAPSPTVDSTVAAPVPETSTTKAKTTSTTKPKVVAVPAVEFKVLAAEGVWDRTPMKIAVKGSAPIGSHVHAQTRWGNFDSIVDEAGYWKLKVEFGEIAVGESIDVRLTNDMSGEALEVSLTRPAPKPTEFLASAAVKESAATPPVNEYWGKTNPGSTVSLVSPYGSTDVVAGADGKWSARLEFPDAPVGTTFTVKVCSSTSEIVYEFAMTRLTSAG